MRRHSLKFLLSVFFIFLAVSLTVLIAFNNFSAVRIIRQQTYETVRDTTYIQRSRIADNLAAIDTYLSGFVYYDAGIATLESDQRRTSAWHSALNTLQKNFRSAISVHSIADDFFLYVPASGLFVSNTITDQILQTHLMQAAEEELFFSAENRGKWVAFVEGETNYLARVIRIYNSYLGCIVNVDGLLQPLQSGPYENLYFDLATADGTLLHSNAPTQQLSDFVPDTKQTYQFIRLNGSPQLLVSHQLPRTDLSLIALVPDVAPQAAVSFLRGVIAIMAVGILFLLGLWFSLVQLWVMRPIHSLTNAIQKLRGGDLQASVDATAFCTEFDGLNDSFNDMVKEIRTLKIDVYEEQIGRQNTEIEYLKLQVTPHFLVNCLNTVYQLTDAGKPDLTRQMVQDLSRHIRYMLNSGASVSLAEEIQLVENFVEFSGIRYPGCIRLQVQFDPAAADATAIPLLILNFVENTVKYEVEIGKIIEIHITVTRTADDRIHIQIWDTGHGFSEKILTQLQDIHSFILHNKSRHIGISNVFQRAQIIMGDSCRFTCSNRPDAGAQIEIDIPYFPYNEQEAQP